MEYNYGCRVFAFVAFAIVVSCFCPHKCTSLIIFGQVVCPNILNVNLLQTLSFPK